jgi:RimJ/RimL family protein N-acetyltransferase
MYDLQLLKKRDFLDAKKHALSILDDAGLEIGQLVPMGEWALDDKVLAAEMAGWRKMFMRFFLTQFSSTVENTSWYIKNVAVPNADRTLFVIFSEDQPVGHIGVCNVTEDKCELDNIIRGRSGGHPELIYYAEKTVLIWAFEKLKVKKIIAQVLSKNIFAIMLHERFGFQTTVTFSLLKSKTDDLVRLVVCEPEEATEKGLLLELSVTESDFHKSLL